MVSVIHDVFLAIAAPEPKARAAAESILVTEQLATQHNIATFGLDIVDIAPIRQTKSDKLETRNVASEAKIRRLAVTVASLSVLADKFMDKVIGQGSNFRHPMLEQVRLLVDIARSYEHGSKK